MDIRVRDKNDDGFVGQDHLPTSTPDYLVINCELRGRGQIVRRKM